MRCEQNELWMMDALDGAPIALCRQRLAAHVEACPRCRAEWDALYVLEEMLKNSPMVSPASGFPERVAARPVRFEAQRRTLA